jgi:hypothetical protein
MVYISPTWWSALSPAWKAVTAILAGIPTIAAAWKPIDSAKDWYIARYDGPVLELLRGRKMSPVQ